MDQEQPQLIHMMIQGLITFHLLMIVMDDDGNTFKVKSDDERFLSGKLKSACFSKKTRIVHVHNENGGLEYECINQNFHKFLKFHNLPYSFLKPYANHDQTPIFQDIISKPTISRLKKTGMYKYKGWYVKRIEQKQKKGTQ